MNDLAISFTATECNGWPRLKFLVDDDLIQDYEFTSDSALIKIPLDLLDGEHVLDIEFYGKTYNNTILVDNNIVKDQLVTLDTICIDNVPVPDFFKYQGLYIVGPTTKPRALTWGENGVWKLTFVYPIVDWLLELKFNNYYEFSGVDEWSTATYHPKKSQLLKEGLLDLENILANVKI